MRKTKAEALWNDLTPEQRDTLDKWLFEEGASYAAIHPRAQIELGFKGSVASLQRYYKRRQKEKILTEFKDVRAEVAAVSGAPVDEKTLRAASMKVLGQFLFRQVRQAPEKVKEWGMVASLLVDNDRNELLRELKGEELKVRHEAMAFARQKYENDMVEDALEALPELQELARSRKDPEVSAAEEKAQFERIRRTMFGLTGKANPQYIADIVRQAEGDWEMGAEYVI